MRSARLMGLKKKRERETQTLQAYGKDWSTLIYFSLWRTCRCDMSEAAREVRSCLSYPRQTSWAASATFSLWGNTQAVWNHSLLPMSSTLCSSVCLCSENDSTLYSVLKGSHSASWKAVSNQGSLSGQYKPWCIAENIDVDEYMQFYIDYTQSEIFKAFFYF